MHVESWQVILGFFLPPVLAIIMQSDWPAQLKGLVALFASVVCTMAYYAVTGQLNGLAPTDAILTVLATSQLAYHLFWKPTDIAPAIEEATNAGGTTDISSTLDKLHGQGVSVTFSTHPPATPTTPTAPVAGAVGTSAAP